MLGLNENMDYFLFLYRLSQLIITGYLFYKITSCFAVPRSSRWLRFLIGVSLSFVGNTVIFNEDPVNVTYAMIGFFLVMLLGYKGSLGSRISAVLILYPIMTVWNFIFTDLGRRIYFSHEQSLYLDSVYQILAGILGILFWWGIYCLAKKRLPRDVEFLDGRTWLFVDIICMASFLAIITAVIVTPGGREWGIYLISFGSLITSLSVFFLLRHFAEKIRDEREIANLKVRSFYYQDLETNQKEIRRIRHDIRNHLGVVNSLLKSEKYKEATVYLDTLTGKTSAAGRVFCENSVVNAVINAEYQKGISQGIDCSFHVDIGKIIAIDEVDLCTIFVNTLDNAIEAAEKTSSPMVTMKARCANGYFSYQIENTKSNVVEKRGERFFSMKEDKKNHGFGLETVERIVKKYGGSIDISYTNRDFTVVVIIEI